MNNTYYEQSQNNDESHVDGLVILNDFDNFNYLDGCRVIIFHDSSEGQKASEEIRKYQRLYYKRIGISRFYEAFIDSAAGVSKRVLPKNRESAWFLNAKKVYHLLK